ncbi:MAG: sensor histidine kinase [Gammaproteobacteria bacterium]|nr:sensor histidine kinase [Gammaproteobacteria bacterium]MDH5734856.1 sensor histidine kinase [Gammaproteobacteria bacterium]
MKSIQSKLVTGLLLSLITIFIILWLAVSTNIQKLAENYISTRLQHDVETLLTSITFDSQNKLSINHEKIDTIYNRPFSGHYYSIQHQNTVIRSRSLWDQSLRIPENIQKNYQQSYQQGPENQLLIVITAHFNKQDEDIIISIAEDLSPVQEDIKIFKNYFSILASLVLISLLIIQIAILKNGLKPLRKIGDELSQLEKGEISQLTTDVPGELASVVNEINQLSDALHKRLKRSRDALNDLSHAIKKPLTVLQQLTDKNHESLSSESLEIANNQIESLQKITDRILKTARVAGRSNKNKAFNIIDDLNILIKTINTMYPDKQIDVTLDGPDHLNIYIDREDMLELMGNLIDNAWKWASDRIIITIIQSRTLDISIEDDGPGIEDESLKQLATRGSRLDETVTGYGFGLAIAADIVRDYDGTLSFCRSETLGGFRADIKLPLKS